MRAKTTVLISFFIWTATYGAVGSSGPGAQSPASGAQPSDPALEAEANVTRNLKTEGGVKYQDSAAAAVAVPLGAALLACRDSLSAEGGAAGAKADTGGMDLYVLLNRRGSAKALLIRPQGKMEACLSGRLGPVLAFPAPPNPNYWIKLRTPVAGHPAEAGKPEKSKKPNHIN